MSKRDTAKLLQFQRGQVQKRTASATANKFTSKQSHYARRSEEEAIAREQAGDGSAADFLSSKFSGVAGKNSAPTFIGKTRKTSFGLNDDSDNLLSLGGNGNNNNNNSGLGSRIDESQIPRDSETGEPLSTKKTRFEEILDKSRDAKAEKKVLRNEQERETDKLDEDFNDISSLLKTKTKKQEAQDEFHLLGTDSTRARLATFYTERNATRGREFVLGADKQLEKKGEIISKNEMKRRQEGKVPVPLTPANPNEIVDERVEALLATLPQQQQKQKKQQQAQQTQQQGHDNEAEDAFDKLLGQMIFSRKAYAGDKTMSAEDKLLERFQEEVVDLDRMKKDVAGRLVPEVKDTTRREWIARGGDDVYRMGADEEDVPLPTATRQKRQQESDSDGDDLEEIDFDGDVDFDDFDIDGDGIKGKKSASKKSKSTTKKVADEDDDVLEDEDDNDLGDDEEDDESPTLNAVDESLAELESALNSCRKSKQTEPIRDALQKLHEVCALRPRMAAESFRLLFLEIHAHHSKRKPLTSFQLLVLRAATNMFPMTDVSRHPVAAPLSSLLPSLMFSGPSIDTPREAAVILFLCSTMMDLLSGGARRRTATTKPFFASEPFVALLNILSLQLPLSDLAPKGKSAKLSAPFPVFLRASEPVLTVGEQEQNDSAEEFLSLSDVLFGTSSTITSSCVIKTAYGLMTTYADTFLRHNPSCPSLMQDNVISFVAAKINKSANASVVSDLGKKLTKTLVTFSETLINEVLGERAPLAMRTFRPRPLRQYEPLLIDDSGDEVKERRVIKKELREGKKRIIRSVTAEAAVERRNTEREARLEDAHRTSKLKSLMAELQTQQHMMNAVDAIKAKGKSKMKKGISGDYDKNENGGGDAGGDE